MSSITHNLRSLSIAVGFRGDVFTLGYEDRQEAFLHAQKVDTGWEIHTHDREAYYAHYSYYRIPMDEVLEALMLLAEQERNG